MQYIPSRKEKREARFYFSAEQGNFHSEAFLYKSEEKSLKKSGFTVLRAGDNPKEALPSEITWENVFKKGLPPMVTDYILGRINTFPKVSNWAQELYVIAARANHDKAQIINE